MFLGDLGLSQVIAHTNIMGTMLAGSPGFQSRNESDIGLPSDIYAYGAVLIVLFGLSGQVYCLIKSLIKLPWTKKTPILDT